MSENVMDLFDVEATEAKEAAAAAPPPAEPPVEPAADPVEPTDPPAEPPVEPVAVDPAPVDPVAPVDPLAPPVEAGEAPPVEPLFMGKYKTPEAMADAFTEFQSHSDRQLAEEKAKTEAYENMANLEAQQQQQMMQMEQQAQQVFNPSPEDVAAGVKQAPVDTYKAFVQSAPERVPEVLAAIAEEHDAQTAFALQNNWTQVQLFAQQQQMQEQMQSQYEQIVGPQIQRQSVMEGLKAVEDAYPNDFDALRKETTAKLAELGSLPSYDRQTVEFAVKTSFLEAHRERAMKTATAAAQHRAPAPGESVETGTPGTAPVTTEEEDIFNQVVNYGK